MNIAARLDRLPWSAWHWRVVTALGVTWILDGLEVTVVGALGGVLEEKDTLGLTESEVGLTATAALETWIGSSGATLAPAAGLRRRRPRSGGGRRQAGAAVAA